MSKFNFKSSGRSATQVSSTQAVTGSNFGIKTPLELGEDEILKCSTTIQDQISDNLRNLILTNWGERIGLYDYGSNIRSLMTDLNSQEDFENSAMDLIKTAISKWMPYVNPKTFTTKINYEENGNLAVIDLMMTYDVSVTGTFDKQILVKLYAI